MGDCTRQPLLVPGTEVPGSVVERMYSEPRVLGSRPRGFSEEMNLIPKLSQLDGISDAL